MNKKIICAVIFFIFVLPNVFSAPVPNYRGIYYKKMKNFTMYLRFFEDGRVISVNVPGKYIDINRWFNTTYRENYGKYSINGNIISFTTRAEEGSVEYSGVIGKKNLTLTIRSLINDHVEKNVNFKFASF